MSLAAISLTALIVALIVSCVSDVNIGVLAIVLAWIVGYWGGMRVDQVIAGFPSSLFLTLVGLTLLFSQAQENGTLDRVAKRAVQVCKGNAGLIPIMFFAVTALISSVGPGNVPATALMAPLAMAVAGRYQIAPFLMAIMVTNGASAGSLSPLSTVGVIVNNLVAKAGLPDARWSIYLNNLLVHVLVAFAGYFLFGGLKLFATREHAVVPAVAGGPSTPLRAEPAADETGDGMRFERRHWLTLAVIGWLVMSAIAFQINVGMAAFAGAMVLTFARAADEGQAIKRMPWKVIMMVTGVTVLVALLEKTGGMDLFSALLARVATPPTSVPIVAFITGLISIYSSTSGVVLPALVPTVQGLVQRMGGGDPMALIYAINSAGHLVDVSPLSTLGALCLAAAPAGTDTRRLFNQLMAWGLSMSVIGALICWVLFGLR